MKETCDDFANFVKKNYLTSAHEADLRFHKLLIMASGNSRLAQLYQRSHIPLFHRKMTRSQINLDDFSQTEKEHLMIFQALQKRDKRRGIELLRAHFQRGEFEALNNTESK
ncbi:MAG: FCD domain-containing protein [Limisphaerales bacterium]